MNNKSKTFFFQILVLTMLLMVAVKTNSVSAAQRTLADGWYMIVCGSSDDRVLDINNWSQSNGGNLEIYKKNNTTNQRYYLKYMNNGYYTIGVLHSKKYLHVAGNYSKANVHQWDGYNTDNALWEISSSQNGYYFIRNKANGEYLDNSGARTSLGNNVWTYPFVNRDNKAQKWKFLSTTNGADEKRSIADGWYEIQLSANTNYVWDVLGCTNDNGANIGIHTRNNGNHQKFYVKYQNNGYYSIMAGHSNKYIHKQNAGNTENIVQWAGYSNSAYQTHWAIISAGNGNYYIRSRCGNFADNRGGTITNGNSVITYNCNKSNAQKWKFRAIDGLVPTAVSLSRTNDSLTVGNGGTLYATVSPSNAANKTVSWSSSNTSVATVNNNGYVTAKAPGTTTITCRTNSGGRTATCVITVKPRENLYINENTINTAVNRYSLSENAVYALRSINSKYASKLTGNWNGVNVFLFEGVGKYNATSKRMNAMCVVVNNHQIVYVNKYCQTIPDNPFNPALNGGKDTPTVISGVYNFKAHNHQEKKTTRRTIPYASLNVINPKVLRFTEKKTYYRDTSDGINVHARSGKWSSTSYNSTGCQVVGDVFSSFKNEFSDFIKAVGVVNKNETLTPYTKCNNKNVTGKIVIDRTYAYSYLKNIGYPEKAISTIIYG